MLVVVGVVAEVPRDSTLVGVHTGTLITLSATLIYSQMCTWAD